MKNLAALFALAATALAAPAAHAWDLRVCADPANLPYTNRDGAGFDNKIAEIIADEMGATLSYQWWTLAQSMITDQLREGNCDVIIGVPDGGNGVISTIAYYRSPYAFVYRTDAGYDVSTFDDEILKDLRIGTETEGGSPYLALAQRGMGPHLISAAEQYGTVTDVRYTGLMNDVSSGKLDMAVAWGPIAGYFAGQHDNLKLVPTPEFDVPFTPMYHTMVMATRVGDESLRDALNRAIATRWDEIYTVFATYGVPTLFLPKPSLTVGAH